MHQFIINLILKLLFKEATVTQVWGLSYRETLEVMLYVDVKSS